MTAATPKQVLDALCAAESLVVLGHEDPDGDCVASQLALAEFLLGQGKHVGVYSAGPFNRYEIRGYEARFRPAIEPEMLRRNPLAVLLDCASPQRTGSLAGQVAGLRSVVIDHHPPGPPGTPDADFGDLRLVDPAAPAAAYLVQLIVESSGIAIDPGLAELLLLGLCTDTGFFCHVPAGNTAAFEAAARLVARGASPRATHRHIYGGRSFAHRRLLGTLLQRTERFHGGRVLFTYQSLADLRELGDGPAGNDELYQLLRSVEGSDVLAFVRERRANECSVSLRSAPAVDVAAVARHFGGGGHRQAAGFTWTGTVAELRPLLIGRLARVAPGSG